MMRRFTYALLGLYVFAVACGGRNLDGNVVPYEPPTDDDDGAGGMDPAGVGGAGGGSEGGAGGEGAGDPNPMPLQCLLCIGQSCPDTVGCLTDPACVQGVGCAVTNCLDGGQPDIMCVAECFDGDLQAALQAVQVLTCVFTQCGDACAGTLPFP